jgi:hypothetical protein
MTGAGVRALEVVMIRAKAPILWKSTVTSSAGAVDAVFVFCDGRKARVEKQRPQGRGASIENEERECRRFNS